MLSTSVRHFEDLKLKFPNILQMILEEKIKKSKL